MSVLVQAFAVFFFSNNVRPSTINNTTGTQVHEDFGGYAH
jgi:hypothetical protein